MNVMAKKNFDMSDLVEELTSENLLEATRGAESTRKTKNDGKKKEWSMSAHLLKQNRCQRCELSLNVKESP